MTKFDRDFLLSQASDYAERLVSAGDLQALEDVFGSSDPDVQVNELSTDELQDIYDEYIVE